MSGVTHTCLDHFSLRTGHQPLNLPISQPQSLLSLFAKRGATLGTSWPHHILQSHKDKQMTWWFSQHAFTHAGTHMHGNMIHPLKTIAVHEVLSKQYHKTIFTSFLGSSHYPLVYLLLVLRVPLFSSSNLLNSCWALALSWEAPPTPLYSVSFCSSPRSLLQGGPSCPL